jgi:hypothetical protein
LLYVSFVNEEENDAVERVLSEILRDAPVKQGFEDERQHHIDEDASGKFIEEEIEVVGEETNTVRVLGKNTSRCVVELMIN